MENSGDVVLVKKLFLVWGNPGAGKSTLCDELNEQFGYRQVSVDGEYVNFIRTAYPSLYFESLNRYVGPHYDCIFNLPHTNKLFQRDVQHDWHDYLLGVIRQTLAAHDRVAVEGYQLNDCHERFAHELRERDNVRVGHVLVQGRRFHVTWPGKGRHLTSLLQMVAEMES
jgi:hypothetical protein